MIKFGLIGNGTISARHKAAIKHVGGELVWISDPIFVDNYATLNAPLLLHSKNSPSAKMYSQVDYVAICSPTKFHRQQTQEALEHDCQVICEKPLCLPWEPLIDDDRINVCLQLRYIKGLPKKADLVRAVMVRDEEFFKSWKGDPRQAGGNLYEFFIHYIDLAILLGADFEGSVLPEGKQVREIIWKVWKEEREVFVSRFDIEHHHLLKPLPEYSVEVDNPEPGWLCKVPAGYYRTVLDIMAIDMQDLYNRMYEDILNGGGIKPKDIFYLKWVLDQNSAKFGFRCKDKISIGKDLM